MKAKGARLVMDFTTQSRLVKNVMTRTLLMKNVMTQYPKKEYWQKQIDLSSNVNRNNFISQTIFKTHPKITNPSLLILKQTIFHYSFKNLDNITLISIDPSTVNKNNGTPIPKHRVYVTPSRSPCPYPYLSLL